MDALYKKAVLEMYVSLRRQQAPVLPEGEAGFFASLTYLTTLHLAREDEARRILEIQRTYWNRWGKVRGSV